MTMADKDSRERSGQAEEVREILGVVSSEVPGLLKGLRDVLYSREAAENMADAAGTFYRKLIESGIPREDAMEMTRGYMINLRDLIRGKGAVLGDRERCTREGDRD
jgi:hypothetical protein